MVIVYCHADSFIKFILRSSPDCVCYQIDKNHLLTYTYFILEVTQLHRGNTTTILQHSPQVLVKLCMRKVRATQRYHGYNQPNTQRGTVHVSLGAMDIRYFKNDYQVSLSHCFYQH